MYSVFFVIPFIEKFMKKYSVDRDSVLTCVHKLAVRIGGNNRFVSWDWVPKFTLTR